MARFNQVPFLTGGHIRPLLGTWLAAALLVLAPTRAASQADASEAAPSLELTTCDAIAPLDLREICRRQELRVARYGGDRRPFFYLEEGEWVGFDVDLARDMAARLGVRYAEDASADSFDEVIDKVVDGSADIGLSKLSSTLDRARRVRFSEPYLTVYQALIVNRLAAPLASDPFRDLNMPKFRLGALAGTAYVGYLHGILPAADIRVYDDFAKMTDDVVRGNLSAALMDSARANTWRRANSGQLIQVRTTIDKTRRDPLAIAVGADNIHLLSWVDLYLDTIRADGTAERLYERWFQQQERAESTSTAETER